MRAYSGSPGLFYAMLLHNNCIRKVWQHFAAALSHANGWYPVANAENCFYTEADLIGLLASKGSLFLSLFKKRASHYPICMSDEKSQ